MTPESARAGEFDHTRALTLSSSESPRASVPRTAAWLGAALVVISSVAFSGKAILAKVMYGHGVEPITVLALRMVFAAPVYLVIAVWSSASQPRLTRRDRLGIFVLGVAGYYGSSLADFLGLRYISAGLERLILFTYPTIVLVLSAFFLRARIGRGQLLALGLTYGGIALVFASELHLNGEDVWLGSGLVFAGAVLYAGYIVGSTGFIRRLGPERFTSWALLVSTFSVLTHFLATEESLLGHASEVYVFGASMGILATVLPTFALAKGIRLIGPGPSAILGMVGPISTLFLAHWFLDEPITVPQLFGAVLVLAGAAVIAIRGAG